ncbi:hypothetical protein B9Q06_01810 [Candidatus Marsarchaeota G2 archaeon ECH_B_2]|uniref:Mechanosensitive ion channel MscS domain-containing protein n=3 Tax=Candidatus Marsarchaeota group 2 TaxID=2203771 RepID=A0A2R6BCL8_9ARCH|nr:MAG: hypothetical protein B9Q06_01810 [Candidatus Marsarchaeota G2 archaeon ECH_B_2]PSO01059.1 MAG: hypothetical protein B9Q07_01150 [Candidatus Marsarchaeota G2 archaeon ECH_B_3]PSO03055.1 MAG: hypothetical protein B9Q05_03110 [Candidatus Marsarchaeota G2 archaeon ECH_B_1]
MSHSGGQPTSVVQTMQTDAQQIGPSESPSVGLRRSLIRLIVLIVVLIVILALIKFGFTRVSGVHGFAGAPSYEVYVDIPVTLLFAVLIVFAFADTIYWNLRLKLPHPEASSVRSVFRIIGIVAAIVAVTASFISATAAAALGALAGIVVGLSTQQVLSQALAGIFLSTSRPFKVADRVNAGGQEGLVVDITSLFTVLDTEQAKVYIPNNTVLTNVIKQYKQQKP